MADFAGRRLEQLFMQLADILDTRGQGGDLSDIDMVGIETSSEQDPPPLGSSSMRRIWISLEQIQDQSDEPM